MYPANSSFEMAYCRMQATSLWQSPRGWTFQGSHDGVVWRALHTVRDAPAWTALERRSYAVPSAYYERYRWHFTQVGLDNGGRTISPTSDHDYASLLVLGCF